MSNQALDEPAPIFKAVNGEVLWRGTWLPKDNAEALLKIFADNARAPDDYAQAFSAEMYDKLSDAMAQAYGQRQ